jgi:hypothetical protein
MESLRYHPEDNTEDQSTAPPSKSKDEDVKQEESGLDELDIISEKSNLSMDSAKNSDKSMASLGRRAEREPIEETEHNEIQENSCLKRTKI